MPKWENTGHGAKISGVIQAMGERHFGPIGHSDNEDPARAKLVEAIINASNYAECEDDCERPGNPDVTHFKKRKRKSRGRKE